MNTIEVFPWNKNFETGLSEIDEQHKQLVHLLNVLASHIAYQSDAPTLNKVFDDLANYAAHHFQTEEAVWHRYFAGDDSEEKHKLTHATFIKSVLKIKAENSSKPLDKALEEVLMFLTHWLAFHILDNDMKMSKIVHALQSGIPLAQAMQQAEQEMSGAMKVLIETIMTMYDTLSSRTLQLAREISERKRMHERLRLASTVVENTLDAICITDSEGIVMEANPSFYEATALTHEEVIGKSLKEIKPGLSENKISSNILSHVNEEENWSGELPILTSTGEIEHEWVRLSSIKDEQGNLSNYIAVFSNITHLIKRQRNLERIAHHDILTGLPNRLLLADRLEQALVHSKRTNEFVAVCFLDLDGFKPINDSYGHAAGDILLIEIAKRLLKTVRKSDTVARIGGDEFVLILGAMKHANDYKSFLDKVLLEISRPIKFADYSVSVSASIGLTIFPSDLGDAVLLLRHADEAMYQAKKMGKSQYCLYSKKTTEH